jgi:Domain of unknown function (DUF4440)
MKRRSRDLTRPRWPGCYPSAITTLLEDTPEHLTRTFAEAISSGDLVAARGCFSHRARLLTPGETTVEGRESIGAVLVQLIGMKMAIRAQPHRLSYLDDLALLAERWHMRHARVEGQGFLDQTTRALSLHRRIDGEGWKIIFLAPWGFD